MSVHTVVIPAQPTEPGSDGAAQSVCPDCWQHDQPDEPLPPAATLALCFDHRLGPDRAEAEWDPLADLG